MNGPMLKAQFGMCGYVTGKNIEGVDHAESLASPRPGGNCANWTLGHIVRARNTALGVLGEKPLAPQETFAAYNAEPITREAQALPWNELVDLFRKSQARLEKALDTVPADLLKKPVPLSPSGNPDETVGSLLAVLVFHEAYHAGQLGMLRRLNGREGAIRSPERARATA